MAKTIKLTEEVPKILPSRTAPMPIEIMSGREQVPKAVVTDFFERFWEESWTYIKTVVDVLREPVLILDKDLRVVAANESFYKMFNVNQKDTVKRVVYDLGDGQWGIPPLRKLLENILPKKTFFKGFEVDHVFPVIGRRVIMLNARQIYFTSTGTPTLFPPIILLAMEDVTEMMVVAKKLTDHLAFKTGKRNGKKK